MSGIENAAVLALDAEVGDRAPTHVITLTTRRDMTPAEFYEAARTYWQAFRRAHGRVEFCGFIEWTTGQSKRSGGRRLMHAHYLVKDWPPSLTVRRAEKWTRYEWRKLAGAWIVQVQLLRTPEAALHYLGYHHHKEAQAPPAGWTGKRFRPSRGYFNRPIAELRTEARLRLAEANAAAAGRDPGAVRARAVLDALKPRIVPHVEPDEPTREDLRERRRDDGAGIFTQAESDSRLLSPEAPIHRETTDEDVRRWREMEARVQARDRNEWLSRLPVSERAHLRDLGALGTTQRDRGG